MKALSLVLPLVLLSLTGCAVSPKPVTPQFNLPASCLEVVGDLPIPREDLEEYISDLIADRTDLAVRATQCRAALIELSRTTAASAK